MTIETKQEIIRQPEELADDERGVIERLGEGPWQSVLRITSKKGTVRANHYHKYDSHLCFLERGKMRYVHRPVRPLDLAQGEQAQGEPADDERATLQEETIKAGQLFYTPPMVAHAMHFLEDSVFYALTPRSGDQGDYENDIVRVTLVDPKEAVKL